MSPVSPAQSRSQTKRDSSKGRAGGVLAQARSSPNCSGLTNCCIWVWLRAGLSLRSSCRVAGVCERQRWGEAVPTQKRARGGLRITSLAIPKDIMSHGRTHAHVHTTVLAGPVRDRYHTGGEKCRCMYGFPRYTDTPMHTRRQGEEHMHMSDRIREYERWTSPPIESGWPGPCIRA